MIPSKGKRAGHVPLYPKVLVRSRAVGCKTSNNLCVNIDSEVYWKQGSVGATYFVFCRLIHSLLITHLSFILLSNFASCLSNLFYVSIQIILEKFCNMVM